MALDEAACDDIDDDEAGSGLSQDCDGDKDAKASANPDVSL